MYQPRKQFLPFHLRNQRWGCIVAHRRAGKTVACINELITRALATKKTNARYAYIGPFYRQVKAIAWDYLKQYAAPILTAKNEVDLEVTLPNGAKIRLFGADNPDSLRGLYLDGVILDEYADMKPSVWGSVIRPMLADRKGWAVFIGTPKGHNAFYDIWNLSKSEDWFSLMLRASVSGLLDQSELDDAKRQMTEDEYEREFECSFEASIAGAIYGKWMADAAKEGRIGKVAYDPNLPVHTAWDMGFSDTTTVWFYQMVFNEIRVIDYYENNMHGIDHYCEVLKEKKYKYGKHWVPQDAGQELMAARGRSIVQQAFDLGIKMFIVPETTQINAHEAVRLTLPYCWFDYEKCEAGVEALKQYQYEWDEDKKMYKKKHRHDWASHASRAFDLVARTWKTPKSEEVKPKPRFLHEATANEIFWPKNINNIRNSRI